MQFSTETNDLRTRKVFVIIFYFSAIIMLFICSFGVYVSVGEYLKTGRIVIGEVLANTEFPFPGHTNLVTYLMITSLLSWFCVTKLAGDKMNGIPLLVKVILQIVMLAVAVIAIYEFIYNLLLWNSFATISLVKDFYNLDNLSVPYPDPKTPWNLVFATQMTLAGFLISAHGFYIISRNITHKQDKYNGN
jgi:hypothetical protein